MNEVTSNLPSSLINNSREIINGYIDKWNKSHNPYWEKKIENITGCYPDHDWSDDEIKFESKSYSHKNNELERIEESIGNEKLSKIPF